MVGDAAGKMDVGAGSEINVTAAGVLLLEVFEELAVIGQMCDVERDRLGNKFFEGGFAADERSRQAEEATRMGTGQHEERIDEGVGFDQRAVEIDVEGP
jgi:hypothetical protein